MSETKKDDSKRYLMEYVVRAQPMTRGAYNSARGWTLPTGENGDDPGYLILRGRSVEAIRSGRAGYVTWMPEGEFLGKAREIPFCGLWPFSDALAALKAGERVARRGWNGKGMFLFLVQGSTFLVNRPPLLGIYPEGTSINYQSHIDMKTADGSVVPWLASQTDLLADDWQILDSSEV